MGCLVDEDAVHGRGGLQARSRVHHVAGSHTLPLGWARAARDQGLPGRDADPYLELALLADPVSDREGCADGTLGIVLVRGRGAEESHDGVADEFLDRPTASLELHAQP